MKHVLKAVIVLFALLIVLPSVALQPNLERYPVQIDTAQLYLGVDGAPVLRLSGSLATGCEDPVQVEMVRYTNLVEISVYQLMDLNVICPAILVPYKDSIYLSPEDFSREIIVNGVAVEFDPQTVPPVGELETILPVLDEFTVEEVALVQTTSRLPVTLTVTGQKHGGCGDLPTLIEQSVDDGWIQIRLYREIKPNIRCSDDQPPFEEQIDLALPPSYFEAASTAETGVVIEINNYIGFLAATEQTDGGTQFQLTAAEREPVSVENVDVQVISGDPNAIIFTVQGILNDGCLFNVGIRMVEGEADYNWEVYTIRFTGPQPLCLAADRTFNKEVHIMAPDHAGTYSYDFNGVSGTFVIGERPEDEPTMRVEHVIESVDVVVMESFPEQISLNVSGYIPDGCKAPTQTEINRDGDMFIISIYRELPFGVLCPMIVVDYQAVVSLGAIGMGDFTFIVNGVTATLNP